MALADTTVGRHLQTESGPVTNADDWVYAAFLCHGLIGARQREMVALLSPAPGRDPAFLFIFRPSGGRWQLSYSKTSSATYIWGLSIRGRTLIEKRPFFNDGLCCPSGYTYWALRWNGRGWALSRTSP